MAGEATADAQALTTLAGAIVAQLDGLGDEELNVQLTRQPVLAPRGGGLFAAGEAATPQERADGQG